MTEQSINANSEVQSKTVAKPDGQLKGQGKPIIPESVACFLDSPPVLVGEDPAEYKRLFEEVALAIGPRNFIEWLWVKDVCDFSWDMRRLQRLKGALVGCGRKPALEKILHRVIDSKRKDHDEQVHRLTTNWFTDPKVKEEVQKILQLMNLPEECINAQAFSDSCDKISKFDSLLGNAASRRNNALKEIERNRASLLTPSDEKALVVEAAASDTSEVPPKKSKSSPAALLLDLH